MIPDGQRRGYGTRLLTAVEGAVAEAGCQAIVLLTRRDMPAAAFYSARGFHAIRQMALFHKALAVAPGGLQ